MWNGRVTVRNLYIIEVLFFFFFYFENQSGWDFCTQDEQIKSTGGGEFVIKRAIKKDKKGDSCDLWGIGWPIGKKTKTEPSQLSTWLWLDWVLSSSLSSSSTSAKDFVSWVWTKLSFKHPYTSTDSNIKIQHLTQFNYNSI